MSWPCRLVLVGIVGLLPAGCDGTGGGVGSDAGAGSGQGALYSVALTQTGWIAVGGRSAGSVLALSSGDGSRWDLVDIPGAEGGLFDAAVGNGTIVAVGAGRTSNSQRAVKTPQDPWQVTRLGTNNTNVLFGNDTFLSTAGVEPGAMVSADGTQWTPVSASAFWVGFAGGRFISHSNPDFRTSVDGVSWSEPVALGAPLAGMTSLAVAGDQMLGFGYRCTNQTDQSLTCTFAQLLGPKNTAPWNLAITDLPWTDSVGPFGHAPSAIATDGTRAIVVSSSAIHSTPLPVGSAGWSDIDVAARGWSLLDVSYGSGTFVAVGRAGARALVVSSSDGVDWKQASLPSF
jgi:hypothetical protein